MLTSIQITTVLLMSSSAMVTNMVITVRHAKGFPGPNPGSAAFLGIMWTTTTLMGAVCGMLWVYGSLENKRSGCHGGKRVQNQADGRGSGKVAEEWKSEKTAVDG